MIFDLGGIVIVEKIKKWITHTYKVVEKDFGFEHEEISSRFSPEHKRLIQEGKLSFLDYYTTILKELGSNLDPQLLLERHMEEFRKYLSDHDDRVLAFIPLLKKKYKVYYLTNVEIETFEDVQSRGILELFDGGFSSVGLGLHKPDLRIYEVVLEKLGVPAEQTVFMDDKPVNADAATAVGMHGLHYVGLDQLKKDLVALGVEF